MSDRLSRSLAGIWVFAGIAGTLFVIYVLLRGSEPISTDILAIGGGVWFTGLSFWAAYVMRAVDRTERRYHARFDRLENRLDERFDELNDRFMRVEERLTNRIERIEERLD